MAWVTCDAADADPIRFLNYIGAGDRARARGRASRSWSGSAGRQVRPVQCRPAAHLGPPRRAAADGADARRRAPSRRDPVGRRAGDGGRLPAPGITIAAAGRTDGGLPLARLRASGRLVEIGIGTSRSTRRRRDGWRRSAGASCRRTGPRPPCPDGGLAGRGLPGRAPRAGRAAPTAVGGPIGRVRSGHGHRRLPRRGAPRPRDAAGARVPDPHRDPRPDDGRACATRWSTARARSGSCATSRRPTSWSSPSTRRAAGSGTTRCCASTSWRCSSGTGSPRTRSTDARRGMVRGQRHARDGRRPPVRRGRSRRRRRAGLRRRPAAVPRGPRGDVRALARPGSTTTACAASRSSPRWARGCTRSGRHRRGGADDRPHDRFGVPRRAPDRCRGVRGGAGVGPGADPARDGLDAALVDAREAVAMQPRASARGDRSRSRCWASILVILGDREPRGRRSSRRRRTRPQALGRRSGAGVRGRVACADRHRARGLGDRRRPVPAERRYRGPDPVRPGLDRGGPVGGGGEGGRPPRRARRGAPADGDVPGRPPALGAATSLDQRPLPPRGRPDAPRAGRSRRRAVVPPAGGGHPRPATAARAAWPTRSPSSGTASGACRPAPAGRPR